MTAGFLIGAVVGATIGVLTMCLAVAARHGDDIMHDLDTYERGVLDGIRDAKGER